MNEASLPLTTGCSPIIISGSIAKPGASLPSGGKLVPLCLGCPLLPSALICCCELLTLREQVTLVLEDYHVIHAQSIHHTLSFLLEHLPSQTHLVIATRSDPPLSLARLRGRGELCELRAEDLRFTLGEASAFFHQTIGLALSPEEVALLTERTEGWIAGLQLAALSLQNQEDVHRVVLAFGGSQAFVIDYLAEEVLSRQSPSIQEFLLKTSILTRLNGSPPTRFLHMAQGKPGRGSAGVLVTNIGAALLTLAILFLVYLIIVG